MAAQILPGHLTTNRRVIEGKALRTTPRTARAYGQIYSRKGILDLHDNLCNDSVFEHGDVRPSAMGSNAVATAVTEDPKLLDELNKMSPEQMLAWAQSNHAGRAAIFSSFQDTGCVMVDMAAKSAAGLRVLTVDTLRLHPETYRLINEVERRYNIEVERFEPDPAALRKMVEQHGEFLFFDSKAKQEYCCQVRKVEPNIRALQTVDVWITGLRRDHSEARESVERAAYVQQIHGTVLKLAPLADWTHQQVRDYIAENNVPYNKLYDQGYTSIGCVICSTPTKPWENKRAGRWRWFNHLDGDDKECGIHTNTGGGGI